MKIKIKGIERKPKAEIRIRLKPKEMELLQKGFRLGWEERYDKCSSNIRIWSGHPLQFPVLVELMEDLYSAVMEYEPED